MLSFPKVKPSESKLVTLVATVSSASVAFEYKYLVFPLTASTSL
jgi:hypothetical protein